MDFLNYTEYPCSDDVVSFSVELNGALKAISDISFISDKTMSRYSRESIKTNHEKLKNYFIPFSKQNSLNRSEVNFSQSYGEDLIAPCSQVHDNFTKGVNRKILINLIYLFILETYLTCANGL